MHRSVTIALALFALLFFAAIGVHWSSADGIGAELLFLVVDDDTEFAPTYTEVGFRSIVVGDGEGRVLEVLGPPLEARLDEMDGTKYLYYSRARSGGHFRVRTVIVADRRVSEKVAMLHFD